MPKPATLVLGLGLLGTVLSLLGTINFLVGAAGGLIAAVALVVEHRILSTGTEIPFTQDNWEPVNGTGFELVLPRKKHGRRNPSAAVFQREPDGRLREVIGDVLTDGDTVILRIGVGPFDGIVRIH